MSLLQCLPYQVYNELIHSTDGWALRVAKLKNLKNIPENDAAKHVINTLDRRGYSLARFYKLLDECKVIKLTTNPTKHLGNYSKISNEVSSKHSQAVLKVAILIGNTIYDSWTDLVTPMTDCQVLGEILKSMGFIVIIMLNVNTENYKKCIINICSVVPEKSYVFVYFAGHGFELSGAKYMLGVECPKEKYTVQNGVSENFVMKHAFDCNPELFILLLDMCRKPPDEHSNPEIYANVPPNEEFQHVANLIIGYATSPYMPSYEKLCCKSTTSQSQHISCEIAPEKSSYLTTSNNITETFHEKAKEEVNIRIKDEKNVSGVSLYVSHLSRHLKKEEDFVKILQLVHKDFANDECEQPQLQKLQKPQKLDNVAASFYLTHLAIGDPASERRIEATVRNFAASGISICLL